MKAWPGQAPIGPSDRRTLESLADLLRREHRRWQWVRRTEWWGFLSVVGGGIAWVAVGRPHADIAGLVLMLLLLLIPLAFIFRFGASPAPAGWRRAARTISEMTCSLRDPRLCGALLDIDAALDASPEWSRGTRVSVRRALAMSLPRLEPEDARELGPRQRAHLRALAACASLSAGTPEQCDLLVGVLLALGTLADEKAAADAKRLLGRHRDERVRTAAAECLRDLRLGQAGPR